MKIYCSRDPRKLLKQYVSKDIWIKVHLPKSAHHPDDPNVLYMRILSESDKCYKVNLLNPIVVDYNFGMNITDYDLNKFLNNISTVDKDDIMLIEPLEAYSTDEIFTEVPDDYNYEEDGEYGE